MSVAARGPEEWLHPDYLRFSAEQLTDHFAPVGRGGSQDPERHLTYYRKSLAAVAALQARVDRRGRVTPKQLAKGRQLEKDERFWVVSALLSLFYAKDEGGATAAFSRLMQRAGVAPPGSFDSWRDALAGPLKLYFEANLSSPKQYRQALKDELDVRIPIPHVRDRARRSNRLEGPTKVDALLLSTTTNAAVLFEAKVLSDVSTHVTFDVTRNQIARNLDAMLEQNTTLTPALNARVPELSSFVLLTPELMKGRGDEDPVRRSRLYGWLLPEYQRSDSTLLRSHLSHRAEDEVVAVASRIGWATWEDCQAIVPGACPWLKASPQVT